MASRLRPRLTYANVMSTIAVFAAIGGGAYAAASLPANSVGTKQLKKNAVVSTKVKDNTLTGADVNEPTLGPVPAATQAALASNADKLGGLAPDAFVKTGTKVGDATHADSADTATNATNAGNAATLGGKSASDFVGTTTSAGGALGGTFSTLFLKPNSVNGGVVADGSLSTADVGEFTGASPLIADPTDDANPVTVAIDAVGFFTITGQCQRSGTNTIASVVITNTIGTWAVDSDGLGGAVNQTDVPIGTNKTLISTGSGSTHNFRAGRFSASVSSIGVNGQIGVEVNRSANQCHFFYTRQRT